MTSPKKGRCSRRLGIERRRFTYTIYIPERRSGKDRRTGMDRRLKSSIGAKKL
ncbi:MAG: hypothetical protein KAI29_24125 [Cyclobacteriaceae bacterium]|nr:hypothetical protein [Cyclobacteriaceae bacterium]